MKIIELDPGSAEWLRHRTASQASAIMGCSRYCSRADMLRMKAVGGEAEVSEWKKKHLLDRGMEIEKLARERAVEILGADLFPVCGETDDGYLSASFDGLTIDGDKSWECKSWNEAKAQSVRSGKCPREDYWQIVQQAIVSGAHECLYEVTDGEDRTERLMVIVPDEDRAALLAAWRQFDEDLANYAPPEIIAEATPQTAVRLPAVFVQTVGSIKVRDNLQAFGDALNAYLSKINKSPETDQDFADLEGSIKVLKSAEDALDAAEAGALGQMKSVDDLRRTVSLYRESSRSARLYIEKLVKSEKENRRAAIIMRAQQGLHDHVESLNKRLGNRWMPTITHDFIGAIRGMKTLKSMTNAVEQELADRKIEANSIADTIQRNRDCMISVEADFLFPDFHTICTKNEDDFVALRDARLARHRAHQEEERARIRAEEEDKARAEIAQHQVPQDTAQPSLLPKQAQDYRTPEQAAAAVPDNGALLRLGEINALLGITMTSDFLDVALGFKVVASEKNAKLYRGSDFKAICDAICRHVNRKSEEYSK